MRILKHKRVIIVIAVIAVLGICGALVIRQFNKPVSATAFTTIGNNVSASTIPQMVSVSGTYASFVYPGTLQQMTGLDGPTGGELAVYNYKKPDVVSWHLAITITRLNEPVLTSDGAYLLRKSHPEQYQSSTATYGSNTYTIMTDTQASGFSKVAFALHGDISADISLTGDDSSDGSTLTQTFQQVLQSWQWQ
jgi:hypothetical protein